MNQGRADICFLAIDPAREETVAFTAPYAVIEGVFGVPEDSPITAATDLARPGVRAASASRRGPPTTCSSPAPWPTRSWCAAARGPRCSASKDWTSRPVSGSR